MCGNIGQHDIEAPAEPASAACFAAQSEATCADLSVRLRERRFALLPKQQNKNFTLKTNPLKREDLDEFVRCYNPENRHERSTDTSAEDRWRPFSYDELIQRDKVSLDIFWLRDESLEDSANLPDPDVIAAEIVEDLQAALEQFSLIAEDLGGETGVRTE
jgi:nitroreductase